MSREREIRNYELDAFVNRIMACIPLSLAIISFRATAINISGGAIELCCQSAENAFPPLVAAIILGAIGGASGRRRSFLLRHLPKSQAEREPYL